VTLNAQSGSDGIDVTAGGATIHGLAITGAALGIHVSAGSSTVIGGGAPSQATTISSSAGAAIEVDAAASGVVVDGVGGLGNGGPFISLAAGANGGAQSPTIVSASSAAVVGLAPPGSVVRLYVEPAAGSLGGVAGVATADAHGVWVLPMSANPGESLAASETGRSGTSELSAPVIATAGAPVAPTATIAGPSGPVANATPTFTLGSNDPVATLLCRIDSASYAVCGAHYQTASLSPGPHTIFVLAAGAGGLGPEVSDAFDVDFAPSAKILSGPPRYGRHSSVVFRFSVPSGTQATQCAIDDRRLKACSGSFSSGYLLDGRHVFQLRTTNAAGQPTTLDTVFTIDTLAPHVTLLSPDIRVAAGSTAVTVACPESEPGGCTGTVRLGTIPSGKRHGFREIGSVPWQAGPSTSVTVPVPLPAWAAADARKGRGLAINLVVVAHDDAGNTTELRRKGKLLAPLPSSGGGTGAPG
jgi:hypothetical protein